MSGVDNRVVEMNFDNVEFEKRLATTLKSIDQLQKSLDFSNSKKGLDDLSAAGSRFNMGNMAGAVEGVSGKFLALATVGITALADLTTKAVETGLRFANAFTFQPITDGFHEFETNMDSIQTILANTKSKGSTLDDVNKSLADLNTYSDKTIYNFTQMAHNIGTFTAAGVDLEKSTNSIKGIANLAALSGSSADQASTAMYQLSQAMASGTVKLMDWNSVVNAGMGGESFQKALFDAGKAMKTLTNVPAGQTFEEWKKAGNSFRDSLQDGWITADVLTTTLNGLSGEMTVAQLKAKGYTDAQAQALVDLGATGLQAATQVKTLTQLVSTVKEAVGSGWTQTFQILFGNFGESVQLFTSINNVISGIVSSSANARNSLLQGWKDLGGRTLLIKAFTDAITAIADVVKPIKQAFREFFPPETAAGLFKLTQSFADFTAWLIPMPETVDKIVRVFRGVFSIFDIVYNVVVELAHSIGNLLGDFRGAGGGALGLAANFGDLLARLDNFLIYGGRLHAFFVTVNHDVDIAVAFLKNLVSNLDDLHISFKKVDDVLPPVQGGIERVSQRFEGLTALLAHLSGIFEGVVHVLGVIWSYISNWFGELGHNIAASLKPGDFDAAVDAVNVGLLGGIVLLLKKFLDHGINLDIGNGFFEKLKGSLDQLTGTLKAMETELKSKALMEIAIAIGVLTASIVVLSLIDSDALTKAMTALAIGFGQLVASMKILDNIASNTTGAAKLVILAAAMGVMAAAAVTLAIAVRLLAALSWEELAKGMSAVTALIGLMVGAVKLLEGDTAGVLAASVAMVAMATAMSIMAGAVALFGTMSWETMLKGLVGVGAALGIIALAMMIMPVASTLAAGLAMIPLATGLVILAGAVTLFGNMDVGTMAKGLVGLAGALIIIAVAMNAMPITLPITAAGLVLVGVALGIMAEAIKMMGSMDFGTMVKGLTGVAALMLILAVGVNAMSGALVGAAALLVVSASLAVLAKVLIALSGLSWGDLVKGLVAVAAVLGVLGLAALLLEPLIPAMLGLGIAMTLLGGGFALFGTGAYLVGLALTALATAGKAGVEALIASFEMLLAAIPQFISIFLGSVLKSAGDLLNAGQLLLGIVTVLLSQVLDTVIKLAPKIAEALVAIITSALILIRAKFPDVVNTAYDLLITIMTTIRDHMGEVTQLAVDTIVNFAETMKRNADKLVNAAADLIVAFLNAIAARANDISAAGLNVLLGLLAGMINNLYRLIDFSVTVVITFVETLAQEADRIATAGANIIIHLVESLADNVYRVADKGVDTVIAFLNAIADQAVRLANGAADALINFLNGLAEAIRVKTPEIRQAGLNIANAIIEGMTGGILAKIEDVAQAAINVARNAVDKVKGWLHIGSPSKVFYEIGGFMSAGLAQGLDEDISAENSAVAQAERIVQAFSDTLSKIPNSIDGLDASPVITPVLDLSKVKSAAAGLGQLMTVPVIAPDVSFAQARTIATTTELERPTSEPVYSGPTEVKFEQNIYSPEALSTNDIFKGTKSQLALAKEELNI